MNLPSVRLLSAAAAALMLGACASQNAAPVVDGTTGAAIGNTGIYGGNTGTYNPNATVSTDNPYATTPYAPNATTGNNGTYVPDGATTTNNGTYVPPAATTTNNGTYVPPAATTTNNGTYVPPTTNGSYAGGNTAISNTGRHTVVKGDTVYNIAKRYGMSEESLRSLNGLQGNDIKIGQTLRVSGNGGYVAAPATRAPVAVSGGGTHQVVKGDTVYNIAKRYGMSEESLRSLNGLQGNDIKIGQILRVSGNAVPAATTAATAYTPPPVTSSSGTHQVVKGDTVYNIAKRYGMSEESLRSLNGLQGNDIKIGQILRVSGNAVPAATTAATAYTPPAPAVTAPATATPVATATTAKPNSTSSTYDGIAWQSPLKSATISRSFSLNASPNLRNIELTGKSSANVQAAADGEVIFSGPGPRGYGNVIIIQHLPKYMTVYGNNEKLLVNMRQQVKLGQTIATLGNSGKMLFEMREVLEPGKATPINPNKIIHF